VTVENLRGIEKVSLDLDPTTVLIRENISGKPSFIDAVRLTLARPPYCPTRRPGFPRKNATLSV
jgi:predicted ATP-dependent endonuclease of OLD family